MLLALLLTLMLVTVGLMAAADVWSVTLQREREQQLLFVGDQYRAAITHYYSTAPAGSPHVLPARLEDLLTDDRFPTPAHHLRRLYPDPMTGSTEWGTLLTAGDRIAGVYSLSERQPVKQADFDASHSTFADKASYRDWIFVVRLPFRVLQQLRLQMPDPGTAPTNTPAQREPS